MLFMIWYYLSNQVYYITKAVVRLIDNFDSLMIICNDCNAVIAIIMTDDCSEVVITFYDCMGAASLIKV